MAEWRRAARGTVDDVDAADVGHLATVFSGDLFGGERFVELHRCERLVPGPWWTEPAAVHIAGVFVYKRAADRKRIDHLADRFDIVWCDDAWARRELTAIFARRGVALRPEAKRLLYERVTDDLIRAAAVAQVAAMAGIGELGEGQCRALLGTGGAGGSVFDVVDLVLAGKTAEAVTAGRDLEAVVVSNQLTDAVSVALAGCAGGDNKALAAATKIHPFVAQKRLGASRRWGPERLFVALEAATWCQLQARVGRVRSDEVICRVAAALAGATSGPARDI
jgi:hypothetical protein